jgi:transcriptional regulator with XRE-family HTH domain
MLMKYSISLNQDILLDLGKRLKQHRLNHNFTSGKLAELSGVSMRTITGFERGEKNISLVNLIELLRALGLVNKLSELIPELPLISPLEQIEIEKKKRRRGGK